jgi:hypothetical protein
MPTNLTDVDTFTDPVVAPADADAQAAATYNLAYQALANRTRNNRNRIATLEGRFDANDEVILSPAEDYEIFIPAIEGVDEDGGAGFDLDTEADYQESQVNNARLHFNVSIGVVPRAASLTSVRAVIDPGASRTGNDRMKAIVRLGDWGSPGVPLANYSTYYTSHGTASPQPTGVQWLQPETAMTPAAVQELVGVIRVVIQCGNNAGANPDKIYGIVVGFSADRIGAG